MGLFNDRKKINGKTQTPVWFMRQAGRYHSHYQNIKKDSDFMTMCKDPKLACEVTMGPINDFDFDAAILFSDLLFPLEQTGMGLSYVSGPPTMELKIKTHEDLKKIKILAPAKEFYQFQKNACELLKQRLPQDKTLIGFVGAPFTLYAYAVEGSHSGGLNDSKKGLYSGLFDAFNEILIPNLIDEMDLQAQGGAQAMALFDTAAGELCLKDYKQFVAPAIAQVTKEFKKRHPNVKVIYYSKHTHTHYLDNLDKSNIDVLGIDWRMDLVTALNTFGKDHYIQGNIDPSWLHLPWNHLEKNLGEFFDHVSKNSKNLDHWIMGLGHGVLQHTPEENVKKTIEFIHKNFLY